MNTNTVLPKWFMLVGAAALLWNALGVVAFFAQMMADTSALPAAERIFYESLPWWSTAGFAVAVGAGVLGSVLLLLKNKLAFGAFIASLAGVVVQSGHAILLGGALEVFGPAGLVLPVITLSIAVALVWFSSRAIARSWLR